LFKFGNKAALKNFRNVKKRPITVSKLTERLGLTEAGIRVFENIDWNGQRAAATGRELRGCLLAVRRF
jgi:hypothetical protein